MSFRDKWRAQNQREAKWRGQVADAKAILMLLIDLACSIPQFDASRRSTFLGFSDH
jgi:hypothetical protein